MIYCFNTIQGLLKYSGLHPYLNLRKKSKIITQSLTETNLYFGLVRIYLIIKTYIVGYDGQVMIRATEPHPTWHHITLLRWTLNGRSPYRGERKQPITKTCSQPEYLIDSDLTPLES